MNCSTYIIYYMYIHTYYEAHHLFSQDTHAYQEEEIHLNHYNTLE